MTSSHGARSRSAAEVAALIDHTLLKPDVTALQIESLCQEAVRYGFAAVCINPWWVALASGLLGNSAVRVCSVVGFPLGATPADVKAYESERAIADGAREIDMVINIGALKSGDLRTVVRDLDAIVGICRRRDVACKVIIEATLLTIEEKKAVALLASEAGANFLKTSTGFAGQAMASDVAFLRETVGPEMGIKAAGGIRELATLEAMTAAGATRIGTSSGVAIVEEVTGHR
jgi:deoxyribose-phosphate aldolase